MPTDIKLFVAWVWLAFIYQLNFLKFRKPSKYGINGFIYHAGEKDRSKNVYFNV